MDPLTALSVAGTIVQFVDFGAKLLSQAAELYKSPVGTLRSNNELELVTTDLRCLITKLRKSYSAGNDAESSSEDVQQRTSFERLCDEAATLAEELIVRLNKLKVKDGKQRIWRSLKEAVETAWSKNEVADMKRRLLSFREALETRVLFSIREKIDEQSIRTSSRFDALDQQTQQILLSVIESSGSTTTEISREIREQMTAQTMVFTQLLSRLPSFNQGDHLRTRRTMFEEICEDEEKRWLPDNPSLRRSRGDPRIVKSSEDDIREIVAEIEMLDVSPAAELRTRSIVQRGILESLRYPTMSDRYEEVLEAHAETFEWAFHDSTAEQQTWSNLSQWLKTDGGIYWVSGKAGSGKSTFMKHVYNDSRTRKYLREWAKDEPLCMATFFFWNSGTKEQKSQSGLLRALLFQVLKKHPELGPGIFPATWTKLYSKAVSQRPSKVEEFTDSCSLKQLTVAFRALIHQKRVPLKICFLIDGLDEFDGDHEEIAELFQEISYFQNIKVCLSSRPWVIFQYLFGNCPNLRLQDLTYSDIERYVQDKLTENPAFLRLAQEEEEAAPALVHEIVEKADGVFLWVKLVVRSLLNGIRNRDEMSHLWERLRLLPRELEPLYSRLLDMVEPIYLVWVSKAFQILRNNRELSESPFPESSAETSGVESLSLIAFYLAMNRDFDEAKIENMHKETLVWIFNKKCADMIVQLTARCSGLLEVSNIKGTGTTGLQSYIRYFHRTARDFLHTDLYWSKIQMRTMNTDFNPNVCMMQSCILQTLLHYKCQEVELQEEREFQQEGEFQGEREFQQEAAFQQWGEPPQPKRELQQPLFAEHDERSPRCEMDKETEALAKDFMIYAHHADGQSETLATQSELIDQFNNILAPNWINKLFPSLWGFPTFLMLAGTYNLRSYVRSKISQLGKEQATTIASDLLRYMLPDKDCHAKHGFPLPRVEMVSLLLQLGANPNNRGSSRSPSRSPWENTLRFFMINEEEETEQIDIWTAEPKKRYDARSLQLKYLQIMDSLVLSGAEPEVCITYYQDRRAVTYSALCIIEDFLIKKFPLDAAPVLRRLRGAMQPHAPKSNEKRLREEEDECEVERLRQKRRL